MLVLNASLAWGPQPLDWDQSRFVSISMVRSEELAWLGPTASAPSRGSFPRCWRGGGLGGWRGQGGLVTDCTTLISPASSLSFLLFHLKPWWGPLPLKISWLLTSWGWVPRDTGSGVEVCRWDLGTALRRHPWEKQGWALKGCWSQMQLHSRSQQIWLGVLELGGAFWSCPELKWTVIRYGLP